MSVWLIRAGREGENEALAQDEGLAVVGWSNLPNLSAIAAREDVRQMVQNAVPDAKKMAIANWTGQLWAFVRKVSVEDLVVLPSKKGSTVAVGRVSSDYEYRADLVPQDASHTRRVQWLAQVPRSSFQDDLRQSMNAYLTVCEISRPNAEARILALVNGAPSAGPTPAEQEDATDQTAVLNLEDYARDRIQTHIAQTFKERRLERLIEAILEAQGYVTQLAPRGADGGVDVIAGSGAMGFESPRIAVQVKSQATPIDVGVLRQLQGVLKNFGADQGLLVSWGGFKSSVFKEARKLFFQIRLWDAGDVVDAITENYDKLPSDIRVELPLRRIWALTEESAAES